MNESDDTTVAWDDDTEEDTRSVHSSGRRGGRRGLGIMTPILLIALLIVGGGTAAAFTVPFMSVKADRGLAQMLPAATAVYLAADLNPSGATRDNLEAIQHAFTDQPGWSAVAKQFQGATNQSTNAGSCYRQTQQQITSHLGDLGHAAAVALISTRGLNTASPAAASTLPRSVQNDVVFLASLDVQLTLARSLSGFNLSLQPTTITYKGVTIYRESFASCGKVRAGTPQTVYAAEDRGYIVLGFQPDPIERVIDVAAGAQALAGSPQYRALAARLPGGSVASYYFSAGALKTMGLGTTLRRSAAGEAGSSALSGAVLRSSSMAAVYAEPDGLRLSAVSAGSGSAPRSAAGQLATQLDAGTLAFVSIQGLASPLQTTLLQLRRQQLLAGSLGTMVASAVNDLTADLSGEADLVFFRPAGTLSLSGGTGTTIPLALLWQVGSERSTTAHLQDLVRRMQLGRQLRAMSAVDGTVYHTNAGGYGYAVRRGWAVVSLSIGRTIANLATPPASSLDTVRAYRKGLTPGATNRSVFYINAHDLRVQLERAILPTAPPADQSQYRSMVLPFLAPIQSVSGSTGVAGGATDVSTWFVGIAHP
ncbi:MAG TPA: DUF3352 domain-containing protein [Chloroflexota bacterium]|nr:DUF3352 domain-containing protein [Chloroflexota bacterium]